MDEPPPVDLEWLLFSGEVTLDLTTRRAYRGVRSVDLTDAECNRLWAVLNGVEALNDALGAVRDENEDPFEATERVMVMSLRRKLGGLGGDGMGGDREPRRPLPRPRRGGVPLPADAEHFNQEP